MAATPVHPCASTTKCAGLCWHDLLHEVVAAPGVHNVALLHGMLVPVRGAQFPVTLMRCTYQNLLHHGAPASLRAASDAALHAVVEQGLTQEHFCAHRHAHIHTSASTSVPGRREGAGKPCHWDHRCCKPIPLQRISNCSAEEGEGSADRQRTRKPKFAFPCEERSWFLMC